MKNVGIDSPKTHTKKPNMCMFPPRDIRKLIGFGEPLLAIVEDDWVPVERHLDRVEMGDSLEVKRPVRRLTHVFFAPLTDN